MKLFCIDISKWVCQLAWKKKRKKKKDLVHPHIGVPSSSTKFGFDTWQSSWDMDDFLFGDYPISFGCDRQTLQKIRNPSSNFCEAWSKDHVRPVSWSSDQICDLWKFCFAFCSIQYGRRTTWTRDVIFVSNLHRYWPDVLKLERCLCLKGPTLLDLTGFFYSKILATLLPVIYC